MQIKKIIFLCRFICTLFMGLFSTNVIAAPACDPCHDIGCGGECDFFESNTQVQPIQAQELIRLALGDSNVKFGEHTNNAVGDDTYVVTDSKGAKHTFWFDDLADSKSAIVQDSVKAAVCRLNGGIPHEYTPSKCYISILSATELNNDLRSFAMTAKCHNATTSQPAFCNIEHYTASGPLRDLTHNGQTIISANTFSDMQIGNITDVINYLKQYTELQLLYKDNLFMKSFACLNNPITYRESTLSSLDDILVCTVKFYDANKDKTFIKTIDFLFDDMYEHAKQSQSAGQAGLICNASGGSTMGNGTCAGFTESMCTELSTKHGIATTWAPAKGGCIMNIVKEEASDQARNKIAIGVGGMTMSILAIPFSSGASTTTAVASATAIVAGIAGVVTVIATATAMATSHIIDAKFNAALLGANQCLINICQTSTTTCRECAKDSVKNLIKATIEFDGEYSNTNANAASYLINALSTYFLNGTMESVCIANEVKSIEKSDLVTINNVAETAQLIGALFALGTGATSAVKNAQTLGSKISTISKSTKTSVAALGILAKTKKINLLLSKTSAGLKNIQKTFKAIQKNEKFIEKFGTLSDTSDALDYGFNVYQTWSTSCSTNVPCDKSINEIINNFDNLCGA